MEKLILGFARADFTPDKPIRMNSVCTGTEVWHKIYANTLYFRQGAEGAVVIILDVRELYPHFIDPIRALIAEKAGVKRENVIMATTHNHSSPDVSSATHDESVGDWMVRIGHPAILQSVEAAVADAKAVTGMEGGKAISEKVTFVRRYQLEDGTWKGIATANTSKAPRVAHESDADLSLRAVRLYREGGKDVILMNYQTHAAGALAVFHDKLNADFPGDLRDAVEEATGAWSVYLQGACGNTNHFTYLAEEKEKYEKRDYRDVAASLAKTTLEALENAVELPLGALQVRAEKYLCDVNHTLDHLAPIALQVADIEPETARVEAMHANGINNRYELWAIINRSRMPMQDTVELASIAFGEFAMAFCPHEMFDELGKSLRDASPYAMTFPCNYANTYCGYMPSHRMVPHGEYEVNMCRFIPGTGETEILALLAQLQDMKNS